MKHALSAIALLAAFPAVAEDQRQLDAHEHGVGTLDIALQGETVAMEFRAPGADLVGFEYEAKSTEDLAKIEQALGTLSAPLALFSMPEAAGCTVKTAQAELEAEDEHDDHDEHSDHDDHDDHDKHEDHDAHADHNADKHDADGHDDHDHDDHKDHEDHADEAESGHTEFHAAYELTCANPEALTQINFTYFDAFPNAKEVEVQIISANGAQAFEVERDAPNLALEP